jgi:uncharacterized protein DUF4154
LTIASVCVTQPSLRNDTPNLSRFAGRYRHIIKTLLALVLFWHGTATAAGAQTQSLEMRLEAAFLYNFARFVEWPGDPGAPASAPVTFCVLGSAEFQDALEQSLAGKTINGHPVLARRIDVADANRSFANREATDADGLLAGQFPARRGPWASHPACRG